MQISGSLAAPAQQSSGMDLGVVPRLEEPGTRDLLCRLWPHLHRGSPHSDPPPYCRDFLNSVYLSESNLDHRLPSGQYSDSYSRYPGERVVGLDTVEHFTGRSLRKDVQQPDRPLLMTDLIGVLGGILFILLMIAFASCIKHRKRLRDEEENGLSFDTLSSQLRQLHQARASQHLLSMLQNLPELPPAPPPDYATVVKEKEEEEDLPSYFQATGELETVFEETGSSMGGDLFEPPASSRTCSPSPLPGAAAVSSSAHTDIEQVKVYGERHQTSDTC